MLADAAPSDTKQPVAAPVVKWAGGKRQLIPELLKRSPSQYNQYVEPFFGGGALFFHLQPENAIIADANAELINLYSVIASQPDALILALAPHVNDVDYFYTLRARDWTQLDKVDAAARTLYLNRTCFNGLYRVNKKGQFNVPFGKYANPKICDPAGLQLASLALGKATILDCDYKQVLQRHTKPGDFVFLDPPYHPISEYSDFKRYTKSPFAEQDQIELADQVARLQEQGCHVLLTNSNSELVRELYKNFKIDVVAAKRNINSKGNKRTAEDLIVSASPQKIHASVGIVQSADEQIKQFPPTRFMGSKSKVLTPVRDAILSQPCHSVLDLFAGSGIVSYMLKASGKEVISNDYMAFSALMGKALIENNNVTLPAATALELLQPNHTSDHFVEQSFEGLYFTTAENRLIDDIRANIKQLDGSYAKAIATSALVRACFKKRPRGIFTYVGQRYDDGRKDLTTSLSDHFLLAVEAFNCAVFDNGQTNSASRMDALLTSYQPDLVYIDPPYYSEHSDNEYVRRYHFVEGIACDWQGVEMQWETKTHKFKNYPTPFSTRKGTYEAFDKLFSTYQKSTMVVSYSSNSKPSQEEMCDLLRKYKSHVEVVSINHRYSFGNQGHKVKANNNAVNEFIFIAR